MAFERGLFFASSAGGMISEFFEVPAEDGASAKNRVDCRVGAGIGALEGSAAIELFGG